MIATAWLIHVGASSFDEVIALVREVRDGCDDPLIAATLDLCIAEIDVWRNHTQIAIALTEGEAGP